MTRRPADRPPSDGPATTGVVLAGGESRRFGPEAKALARFDGVPLVERVVETIATSTDSRPVVAVGRVGQREPIEGVVDPHDPVFAVDAETFAGPVAGLAAAARVATTPWLFVCACDMPLLSGRALEWLGGFRTDCVDAVVPVVDGHRQPLHGFYRLASVRATLPDLPPAASLRRLLDELPVCHAVPARRSPPALDLERSVRNVNTRGDLEALDARP